MKLYILAAIVMAAVTILENDEWRLGMAGAGWETKFAWWFTFVRDTDGKVVLLWLEKYEERRVDELQVARRYKGGEQYLRMSPGF